MSNKNPFISINLIYALHLYQFFDTLYPSILYLCIFAPISSPLFPYLTPPLLFPYYPYLIPPSHIPIFNSSPVTQLSPFPP
ncbi:hypothetical protein NBO_41g0027 [Nosema bombycis CQ1]|uniref:Uncharacterized protein n=1 Tax=Nosema bombycis (strain CQ1 / CVCC 102059) TaxID=578461 RepID=R0KV07_NOSB1|nr:hypothetical protein NBO_41g0027 [Nosema bombycis CQ1]|eukprot:EOB14052.1 hypothetical protein NBO_41g0027 [Nosema bombycis CQ1]